ncbi:uncharacterized protein F5891DRAFT_1187281 [Suillus fuscotomentosus]|uniref:Uncharacterized protein n=1 Tax=Suillus fuscotomentosus TaxID=1912939 RepID=A0AAD4EB89_9AGAM|nr:uncharacterized protein F5891DRAFT_1187281 [Suillus fuscotomentosus]KAG1901804.1 hypothetical protein F5891DRAFT_1187281 [Suillus fuscotomentosus]
MISHEYWVAYHEKLAALDLDTHLTSFIPQDWALNAVDIASEWVEQQFAAHVAGRPLVPAPPELDPETMLACGQLAFVLAEAYQHPIKLDIDIIRYNQFPPAERILLDHPLVVIDAGCRIILWYLPGALNWSLQRDMFTATVGMGKLLQQSMTTSKISTGKTTKWRTNTSYFHPSKEPSLIPGCINLSPCWFQQGHECQGRPPQNPLDGFIPEVSSTLKGR